MSPGSLQWAISSNCVVLHQEGASQRPSPCANTVHFTADCSSTGRHAATSQQPRRPPCKTTAVMDGIVGAEHIASAQAQRWNQGTAQEGHDAAASANPQPRAKADDGWRSSLTKIGTSCTESRAAMRSASTSSTQDLACGVGLWNSRLEYGLRYHWTRFTAQPLHPSDCEP